MTEKQLKSGLRLSHRWVGLGAALLVIVTSVTGLLLQHPHWLGEPSAAPSALAIDPTDGDRWLRGNRWGVEVSADRGATWREIPMLAPPSEVHRITFAPDDTLAVLALGRDALVASADGGRVWRDVSPAPQATGPSLDLIDVAVGPRGQIALLTDRGLLESLDGGETWGWSTEGSTEPSADLRSLVHDLHTGQWLGTPGRRLVELGALALIFVTVTGLVLYRRNGKFIRR